MHERRASALRTLYDSPLIFARHVRDLGSKLNVRATLEKH